MEYSLWLLPHQVKQGQRSFIQDIDCFIQGSQTPILWAFPNLPMLPNSCFGSILMMFFFYNLCITFPGINSLDMLMCSQLLNNDNSILETGLYCRKINCLFSSKYFSQNLSNLLRENVCNHIYSFFIPKSSEVWQLL